MPDSSRTSPAVGIDLGTTNSVVAHLDAFGRPESLRNAEGDLTTPSVVFFDKGGAIVGKEAVLAAEYEPSRIARHAKRDMGENAYQKQIRGESLPPEVVQAIVLRKLKADAESHLGEFSQAVITVPAYFNEPRRKATQDSARLAGIELLDIINEPTAAAIMYGIQQGFLNDQGESAKQETILVYDLGGGTFDATLMEIDGRSYQCIGTHGEVQLGGIDWDRRLVDRLAEEFQNEHKVDPRGDECSYEILLHQAVEAKHALSIRPETTVNLNINGLRSRITINRETFDSITRDLLDRTLASVARLLEMTKKSWNDLTQLVLVGGSTRMPMVHERLERESGLTVDRSLSPDEAVAHGAALYAGLLLGSEESERRKISVENVNSHDLGILVTYPDSKDPDQKHRRILIPRNTPLPASQTEPCQTAKFDQRSVLVEVVEGGDDLGRGATKIAKCVVTKLPPELPAGIPVNVVFNYQGNGRLTVEAIVPTTNRKAVLEIERAAGLSEERIAKWKARIEEGMTDRSVEAGIIVETDDRARAEGSSTPPPARLSASPPPLPSATSDPAPRPATASTPAARQSAPKPLGSPKPLGVPKKPGAPRRLGEPATPAPKQLGVPQPVPKPLGQPLAGGSSGPKPLGQPVTAPKPLGQPQPGPSVEPDATTPPLKKEAATKGSWKDRAKRVSAGDE